MNGFRLWLSIFVVGVFLSSTLATRANRPKTPHVLFFFADDLGHGDVGYLGSPDIPTPTIDALAASGVKLGRYYVQPFCSPSRAALMTGRYPGRTGMQHLVVVHSTNVSLPLTETLLPQWLKTSDDEDENYATHLVGKWHLGMSSWQETPTERGFDSHFGFLGSHVDYYAGNITQVFSGYDFRFNKAYYNQSGVYNGFLFVQRAKDIIANHDPSTPLFMYFSSENAHTPLQVPQEYITNTACASIPHVLRQTYCGMVVFLDEQLKNVTDALKEKGMWEDTVLIFSTDNGGEIYQSNMINNPDKYSYASNWPLRGGKASYWEGGVKGVGFVAGKGLRPNVKGTTYNGLIHVSDWYSTIIEGIARVRIPSSYRKRLDSINQWRAISRGEETERKEVLINYDPWDILDLQPNGALIVDDMKVVYGKNAGSYLLVTPYVAPPAINQTDPCAPYGGFKYNPAVDFHLYNLTADPCECRDLAFDDVRFTWHYVSRLFDLAAEMEYPQPMVIDPASMPALHGGIWTPWKDSVRRHGAYEIKPTTRGHQEKWVSE